MTDVTYLPVPHNARMEKSMEPGQMVAIRGQFPEFEGGEDADPRLTINLCNGANGYDCATIPLHINLRFKDKKFILNTKNNGEFGKEVKKSLPWKSGDKFDLRVRVHADKFEIMADHKDFMTYDYQLPLTQIDHLFVDMWNGPVMLHGVQWGGRYYSVPYETGISSGFGPGKRLFMSGIPEKKCDRFHLNLVTQNGDIAMHLNPRFSEKKIIRNSRKAGEWENEEKEGEFPFKKDQAFDLVISNESYSYQVYVNDEKVCTFAHRMDPHSIAGLQIDGEIELLTIMIV